MAPPIELDATLKGLYELSGNHHGEIYLITVFPTAQAQTIPGLAACRKYAFQDGLWPKTGSIQARLFTQVLPQWLAMIAGQMKLVMFDLEQPGTDDVDQQARADTAEVLGQICERQRPTVIYVRNTSDIVLPPEAVLSVVSPLHCLEHLPALVPFDSQYRALSKRDLALSSVPTPPSTVIDTVLDDVDQVQEPRLRKTEVARILGVIEQTAPPFVIKFPQGRGGFGTLIVRSESERAETVTLLRPEIDNMLQQLNHSNRHLHPASLIVQKMVHGSTVALCMFLPKDGAPIISSCTDQLNDNQGHWEGSHIDYSQQSRLRDEVMPVAELIGAHLRRLGYYGPVGADIMIGPNNEHFVVDLNARLTASHLLGFMKGHFSVDRGLNDAAILVPIVDISLREFKRKFSKELDEGRIVIAGWSHGPEGKLNVTAIVVAAEDMSGLNKLAERVHALKAVSSFASLPTS